MPQYPHRNYRTSVLDTANPDDLSVQTDSQGYHEIKQYNETKDNFSWLLGNARLAESLKDLVSIVNQIDVNLLVADGVWNGIQYSTLVKTEQLYAGKKSRFEYKGEFMTISKKFKRYIEFFENPRKFINEYDKPDADYAEFTKLDGHGQMDFLKERTSEVVSESLRQWSELAARIGFGMPLKIAEEKEIFFRG